VGMDINYNKYLKNNNPIDNAILELIKEDKLKIKIVIVGNENPKNIKDYTRHNFA
jgi:hypothetical protein